MNGDAALARRLGELTLVRADQVQRVAVGVERTHQVQLDALTAAQPGVGGNKQQITSGVCGHSQQGDGERYRFWAKFHLCRGCETQGFAA